MPDSPKPATSGQTTVEITLPTSFWEEVRQKGWMVDVEFEKNDLQEIAIRAIEKCLSVRRQPLRQTIPYKL